jgi:excisionase family DNA binding protein
VHNSCLKSTQEDEMKIDHSLEPKTLSVPDAGARYFGLSRNGAYEAARRGELPVIRIGRLMRVSVAALERMLDHAGEVPAAGESRNAHQNARAVSAR